MPAASTTVADGPGACEELVGQPQATPRESAHALEGRQHHDRAAAGTAEEKVSYDERIEHAPPSPPLLRQRRRFAPLSQCSKSSVL